MAIEYLGLNSVNGPFVVLEGVKGAAYDEIVEIVADGKEKKLGRIVEINEDKAVVQVFEGTDNLSLKNTHTRLTGHPMEIGLTDQLLGRTFNGIGAPIDNLGEVAAEKYADVYHPFGMFCDFNSVEDYFQRFENMLVVNTGVLPRAGGINSTCAVLPLVEEYVNNVME